MKCRLCDQYFVSETSFGSLFLFEELCDRCKLIYMPQPTSELIPIDVGELNYTYYFPDNLLSVNQKEYLMCTTKEIYRTIRENMKEYNAIIIIEDYEYDTFSEWFTIIKNFKKILFISLSYFFFDKYVNFF